MTEEQKQKYVDDIVCGSLPDQESYTKEEVREIAKILLVWSAEQIDHSWGEMKHDDVPDLVAQCEYKTIEEGIEDVQEGFENDILGLRDFITDWIE